LTASVTGNVIGDVTGFASENAPLPQPAAGVGQILTLVSAVNTALYLTNTGGVGGTALPGTWKWEGWVFNNLAAMFDTFLLGGPTPFNITAGGLQILPAYGVNLYTRANVERIA
jgi:hypothetical protein